VTQCGVAVEAEDGIVENIKIIRWSFLFVVFVLAACGGGHSSSLPPASYEVGGSVAGLAGSGLEVSNSGGAPVSITGNGQFQLGQLAQGTQYNVSVQTQPSKPAQTCMIANGAGLVGAQNVTDITIQCTTNTYSIGGAVSGLGGGNLVLASGSDSVTVEADGSFTFPTKIVSGSTYSVTVSTQPDVSPAQFCTVANGGNSGTVAAADITDIQVDCVNVGKFLYLVNSASNAVSVYSIDAATGALSAATPAQYPAGSKPEAIAVDEAAGLLYVANYGDGTVSAYLIDGATGALTAVTGSPFGVSGAPIALALAPSGSLLYVETGNSQGISVLGFSVNQTTGVLSAVSGNPVASFPGTAPAGAVPPPVFHPSGDYLYFPQSSSSSLATYQVDATSGSLTSLGSVSTPFSYPFTAVATPDGGFLYATGDDSGLLALSIAGSGSLTALSGSPFPAAMEVGGLAIRPTGGFVYVSDCNCRTGDDPGSIDGFSLDGQTGAPTAFGGRTSPAGTLPTALVFDPSGKFAYEANTYSLDISGYSVDANTGALTAVPGSPLAIGGTTPGNGWLAVAISN
jgi:6-phosphogluconolactonase (cycloisomerase 2 family)